MIAETVPAQDAHAPFITVYLPIAGWKAVMYWWNPEGFWEPWETAPIAFPTREAAVAWGKDWAEEEGIEFRDDLDPGRFVLKGVRWNGLPVYYTGKSGEAWVSPYKEDAFKYSKAVGDLRAAQFNGCSKLHGYTFELEDV